MLLTNHKLVLNTIVKDILTINKEAKEVVIFNAAGNRVKTIDTSKGNTADLSTLPSGMYIVTGVVADKQLSEKIIKR